MVSQNVHCCSVAKSCPTLCDPMDCSTSFFPVHHYLPELAQTRAGLDEAQAGIKIVRRNINNLRYVSNTILMGESEEELKSFLKVKEESEKVGLKFKIQKTKIMTSSPIISWQIDGGKMERVKDFIFLGFKITVDSDVAMKLKDSCSWKNYDKPRQCIRKAEISLC